MNRIPIERRRFLRQLFATGSVGWLAAGGATSGTMAISGEYANPVAFVQNPHDPRLSNTLIDRQLFDVAPNLDPYRVFNLSVASGDPRRHGIVLWTRINPESIPNPQTTTTVAYQVARAASFAPHTLVLEGLAEVKAERDYVVKLAIGHTALEPFTTYYYRFIYNRTASRTGRFKTLPAETAQPNRLRFAFVSCQDYSNGFYTAFYHLAQEQLDFVVHLGDYIYETIDDPDFQGQQVRPLPVLPNGKRLPGGSNVAQNLEDYRYLYKVYRSDRNLQLAHEQFAFIQIWDDHEFANDSHQAFHPDNTLTPGAPDPALRQAANQAWAEYSVADVGFNPLQFDPTRSLRIYRSFRFGTLLELVATDERLYRDGPPCGLNQLDRYFADRCPEAEIGTRTMLGETQRKWFLDTMTETPAVWKVWANEVMLMQFKVINTFGNSAALSFLPPGLRGDRFANLDQWDGYPAERANILTTLRNAGVRNVIAITGDIHTFIAGYLKTDYDEVFALPVGVELVVGSVTSGNLSELIASALAPPTPVSGAPIPRSALSRIPLGQLVAPVVQASNPHIAFFDSSTHGYAVLEVTQLAATCRMKAVSTIRQPQATLRTLISFTIPRNFPLLIPSL